ncbi:MAG TPA: glycosyltransferase [Nevskiaceae bacterium]|nr:glycosyltransferase [Nevskiaceae bacterium]
MNQFVEVFGFAAFALLTSYWVCRMVIGAAHRLDIGTDELAGVQKMHRHRVSRLGGVPIFLAFLSSLLFLSWTSGNFKVGTAFLVVCMLPAFGFGLVEDLTRRVGATERLIAAMISGALGWWLFSAGLVRIGWEGADIFLETHPWAVLVMTVMAASGSAHGVNIIDGCNGLSGFFIMSALAALMVVAAGARDMFVFQCALLALASTAGFFAWNFPNGRIFLGDSGAYMMGFLIAQLAMILFTRHPEVSPWCAMLIMAYPAWETLFSMYRRSRHGLRQLGKPDARHLHHLVYRRILKWAPESAPQRVRDFRSAFTSVLVWPLMLLCMMPAAMFWYDTKKLFLLCWLFALTYTAMYVCIARFKVAAPITRLVTRIKRRVEQAEVVPAPVPPAAARVVQ